ncbi:MAG: FHA domain-containing protein [Anaerolinea sp.]|nr:FHA domain-containing protein [Anaerolinea sp.]
MTNKTGKLTNPRPVEVVNTAVPQTALSLGLMRPWRMVFVVKDMGARIVVDVTDSVTLGRVPPTGGGTPTIDLRPFGAEKAGVSRKHLVVKVEGDGVYAADFGSANGSLLNGKRLEPNTFYPIHHQDEIVLGLLQIVVELLIDPLS